MSRRAVMLTTVALAVVWAASGSVAVTSAAAAGGCLAAAITGLAAAVGERRRPHLAPAVRALARRAGPRWAAPLELQARLEAAGAPLDLSAADVMALKIGAAVAAGLLAVPAASLAPGRLGLLVLVTAPVAGFLAPDLVLHRRARSRAEQAGLELAGVAELLRVAIDAGLPPLRALEEIGRHHGGLLASELGTVSARTALGVPQEEALAALTRRVPVAGVRALAAALARAATHGAPLGPSLAAIGADARADRARRLRENAARAAPKIQLVVALLLVPAVLLLVAAALAASLLT